tara:strand:+ start:358 stop:909 length:552 start_codon:yes stop_codon:yes gene_type:complete
MIRESIVITTDKKNKAHVAPMGVILKKNKIFISPFIPSQTYLNLKEQKCATINFTDDVKIFSDCILGKKKFQIKPTKRIKGFYLEKTLSYLEVRVDKHNEDKVRPKFDCKIVNENMLKPFRGFNRAQASIIEAAILISRLKILPLKKIKKEIKYLKIAVEKTAGVNEKTAWKKLMNKINSKNA